MSVKSFVIASLICAASAYGAYVEHTKYSPVEEAIKTATINSAVAGSVADDICGSQGDEPYQKCYNQTQKRVSKEMNSSPYNVADDTKTRNFLMFVAFISFVVAIRSFSKPK